MPLPFGIGTAMAGRLKKVSHQSPSLCLSALSSQTGTSQTHTVYACACTCAYVCNSFSSPPSQSLREKINYPDSVKSTQAIPLDMGLNPAPGNQRLALSNRDTYVVLATGCLMGGHVILSSRFFLLFTGREGAHVSNRHFYFLPSSILLPAATR